MAGYWLEWSSLLGRWTHLVTGIAWIGASFYFVWLDNHLLPPGDAASQDKGVSGELWAVHGGGFYHSQKYRLAPQALPGSLHWFYWEAYATFLSGLFLLCVLYYFQPRTYLIDPRVMALSPTTAVVTGVGFIVGGWLIYDALCKTRLAQHGAVLGGVIALLCAGAAFALCHLFSGRGAYIQFGAMLGTIMVANVFFVIIPGQRGMVQAKREGREPDPAAGIRGKQRSVHNTYFTLPVLFTMISNHYALAFNARYNWLVLIAFAAAGALLRIYFVARHKRHDRGGRTHAGPALAGLCIIAATAAALAPYTRETPALNNQTAAAEYEQVRGIITARCVPCHAVMPSQPGFAQAPQGLQFDTEQGVLTRLALIETQLATRAMPIGNLTNMTEAERARVLDWIHRGAPH